MKPHCILRFYFPTILTALFFLNSFLTAQVNAQHVPGKERGNPQYRLKTHLEGQRIRTTVFNFGQTGRQGAVSMNIEAPYVWPKGSGQVYLALTGLFIGAEIIDEMGNIKHSIIPCNYKNNPDTQESWNLEPVPGYYNENLNLLAHSNFPDSWSGEWHGYLGLNQFIKGPEIFYRMSDDLYNRYSYYPDATDSTRAGLGLIVDVNTFTLDETYFEDMVFQSYRIKNDGTKFLQKINLIYWFADFVGGDGDSADDYPGYDLDRNLYYSSDSDSRAPTFGDDPVGIVGAAFLKTPHYPRSGKPIGISSIYEFQAGGLDIYDDEQIWQNTQPGNFVDTSQYVAGEADYLISSGYFSLAPGETTELLIAIILSNGMTKQDKLFELFTKTEMAQRGFASGLRFDVFVTQVVQPENDKISGNYFIDWTAEGYEGEVISYVFHSPDLGRNWHSLAENISGNSGIDWNSTESKDGILNLIKVITFAENGISTGLSKPFVIDNPGNAPPQVFITYPAENDTFRGMGEVEWIAGDADGDSFEITVYFREKADVNWQMIADKQTSAESFIWDSYLLPNSQTAQLKAVIHSLNDSSIFITEPFTLENNRNVLKDTLLDIQIADLITSQFEVHVVDENELTGHTYQVIFRQTEDKGTELVYDVYNKTRKQFVVNGANHLSGLQEGPYFDGVRLWIKNDTLKVNNSLSGWSSAGITPFHFEQVRTSPDFWGYPKRSDYEFVFGLMGIDTSTAGYVNNSFFPAIPVNFKVRNISEDRQLDFIFIELDESGGPGRLTVDPYNTHRKDRIFLLENNNKNSLVYTWQLYLDLPNDNRYPDSGDTLRVILKKPFLDGDTLLFSTDKISALKTKEQGKKGLYFDLKQNYPNPFNASTIINCTIAEQSDVRLTIYNILGQKVMDLVKQRQPAGNYTVTWEAGNVSSGLYIIVLQSGSIKLIRKALLLK